MMIAREYSPTEGARDCKKQVVAEIFSFNATRIKLKLVEEMARISVHKLVNHLNIMCDTHLIG